MSHLLLPPVNFKLSKPSFFILRRSWLSTPSFSFVALSNTYTFMDFLKLSGLCFLIQLLKLVNLVICYLSLLFASIYIVGVKFSKPPFLLLCRSWLSKLFFFVNLILMDPFCICGLCSAIHLLKLVKFVICWFSLLPLICPARVKFSKTSFHILY